MASISCNTAAPCNDLKFDSGRTSNEGLRERTEHLDIFLFSAHYSMVFYSDVLFTGGRGMSDFSVLNYHYLNTNYSVNILNVCLRILINCSQLSKTYYNVLFGSST